jgi:hypothetical protein
LVKREKEKEKYLKKKAMMLFVEKVLIEENNIENVNKNIISNKLKKKVSIPSKLVFN